MGTESWDDKSGGAGLSMWEGQKGVWQGKKEDKTCESYRKAEYK